jgi:Ca2+/Na+ antiporter
MELIIGLLVIILCCLVIWRASHGFDIASVYLGRNLSDGVRGATINAIGSSIPELFTTLFFLFAAGEVDKFSGGIATTAGSAIFNAMIIPAVIILAVLGAGLTKKIEVSKKVILRDGISLIIAELILIYLISGDTLHWWHGVILMSSYVAYVAVLLFSMKNSKESEGEELYKNKGTSNGFINFVTFEWTNLIIRKEINQRNALSLLLATMGIIGVACFFLVHSCEMVAHGLGVNTFFVAVILASAATSVPDTILSYKDALAGNYDDALANAIGSNIFDVCFALGFPLFLYTMIYGPIGMSVEVIDDIAELRITLLMLTIVAFLVFYIGRFMGKTKAFVLIAAYLSFTFFIVSKAMELDWAVQLGEILRSAF